MGAWSTTAKGLMAAGIVLATAVTSAQADTAKYIAKIGHLEPAQQTRNQILEKVAKLVSERTNGEVKFELFPAGQLGTQQEMTQGVQLGTIQATVAPAAFLGGFNPAISVLDIPYLLPPDVKQQMEIMDGPFGQGLCATFDSKGVKCLGFWPNGLKNFTSNKPIATPADFAGQKFRVMDSKILIAEFKGLGASAIALPFGELYTSLQTGVVDGEENPLDTIKNMKFYEVQKNLLVSNHGAMEDVILFNPTWWNSLPAKDQTIIQQAFVEVTPEFAKEKQAAVAKSLAFLEKSGMNVTVATPAEQAKLRERMYPMARDAYVAQAGAAGKTLIAEYETAYKAATGK